MKKSFISRFNGYDIYTYLQNGKICWVALQIVKSFNYLTPSKVIHHCIKREQFIEGLDYDILTGATLKSFKISANLNNTDFRFAPKLIIFYESGLFGFLNYCSKPETIPFKSLVRYEILPSIRKDGYYTTNNSESSVSSNKKLEDLCTMNDSASKINNPNLNLHLLQKIENYIDISDIPDLCKLNLLLNLYEGLGNKIGTTDFIDRF